MHESHHEDVQQDACSFVSDRKLANGFSSIEEVVSDQSKRDVLVEGSAFAALDEFQHDCLVAEEKSTGFSAAGKAFLKDDVKSKEKGNLLAGDCGGAAGVSAVKRRQSWQELPWPSIEHS